MRDTEHLLLGWIGKTNGILAPAPRERTPPESPASPASGHPAPWILPRAQGGAARCCAAWPCRAGGERGGPSGVPRDAGLGKGGRGGEMQPGSQTLRGVQHPSTACMSLTSPRATSWAEATQSHVPWRERAGAMGGGTEASWRWRRRHVLINAWGRTARLRSTSRRHKGQVAIARAHTRPRSRAQLQRGVPVLASCPSTPCWRSVGVTAPRRLLCALVANITAWRCSPKNCGRRWGSAHTLPASPLVLR